jgi:transcriptional regulator with XRE-family HTH domain
MSIGSRIKMKREEFELFKEQLASKTDLSLRYIFDIENVRKNMTVNMLLKIRNAFGISADWLLDGY